MNFFYGDKLLYFNSLFKISFSYREELLPLADIVTPNLKEASALLGGVPLETVVDMRSAAKLIHDIGPRLALKDF